MTNQEQYDKLEKLSLKYEELGIIIEFRFNRFGLILAAYTNVTSKPYCYNHFYSYQMINNLPNDYSIEMLCDEFAVEFLTKLHKEKL